MAFGQGLHIIVHLPDVALAHRDVASGPSLRKAIVSDFERLHYADLIARNPVLQYFDPPLPCQRLVNLLRDEVHNIPWAQPGIEAAVHYVHTLVSGVDALSDPLFEVVEGARLVCITRRLARDMLKDTVTEPTFLASELTGCIQDLKQHLG